MENKLATTQYPINKNIEKRWSPRAFKAEAPNQKELLSLLEAARWAPSSFNEQPWRFFIGVKGAGNTYDKIFKSLNEFNQEWAINAPILLLAVGKTHFSHNDAENKHYAYDTGAAMALLAVQAAEQGIYIHQMAGFSKEKAREIFSIPEGYVPVVTAAIGYPGDPEMLNQKQQKAETAPRKRKDIDEIVFQSSWGQPMKKGDEVTSMSLVLDSFERSAFV